MNRFSQVSRIITAAYFAWLFFHIGLLVYADENADSTVFWPFIKQGQTLASTYDIFEFFVYTGVPLVLFICYRILFPRTDEEKEYTHRRHSSHSFFLAFLDEKIKVEELTQELNALNHKPVNNIYLEELKKDRMKAGNLGVNGWLERLEVKKKYKEYEKPKQNN